ncbi:hypothetical protein J6590_054027 [Homalodisca vitripennis]|nr:hypothetical protein J6590_054027 [Homalodisca vitripennis]
MLHFQDTTVIDFPAGRDNSLVLTYHETAEEMSHNIGGMAPFLSVEQYFVNIKQELSYRKPLPILRQRSKSSGVVDNVIAESRHPFSWCVTLLYFRVLPLHFSKQKNSTKTNITKLKLNSLLKKHSKLVFILDHISPTKMRVRPAIIAGFASTFGAAPR